MTAREEVSVTAAGMTEQSGRISCKRQGQGRGKPRLARRRSSSSLQPWVEGEGLGLADFDLLKMRMDGIDQVVEFAGHDGAGYAQDGMSGCSGPLGAEGLCSWRMRIAAPV